ncbi:MAG: ABC transporter ATP-binding protein/permease [Lachnospiraceae bacterium]|nr:ABC transporter ATP-binding protein/permease [Lachnospiraceae bacterium]
MRNKSTFSKLLERIKPYSLFVVLSMLLAFFSVILTLVIPLKIGQAIDCIGDKTNWGKILPVFTQVIILSVIVMILQWVMNLINNKITYYVVRDLRNDAIQKIETLPLSYIDSHSQGDIVSRIIADADQFADGLLMGFTQAFSGVVTIIGTLIFMIRMSISITLVVVLLTPLSLFVASFISKKTFNMFKLQSETRGEQTAFIDEMISNEKVVKAFSREEQTIEKFASMNEDLKNASLKAIFFSSLTNPMTRFVYNVIYAFVALFGAIGVISGNMSIGILTCMLSYVNQYTKPFNEITGVITELQNAFACIERIFELLNAKSEPLDKFDAVCLDDLEGNIEIKDVFFSYNKEKNLIEDFNLSVKKGQKVAIVGPTGAGKSTIINLLMRYYDTDKGIISVDGYDIKDIQRESLRSNYGMVLQETWLRNGTIRDNICLGKPDASEEEILRAAKSSHAHSFIRRLENGYDTIISDDGGNLSQGQKQLLCIARIMLLLPPMLILDEATSSIDTRTEKKIQSAFNMLMEGKTSFIIAHRLSTIKNADIILVMKNGRIIESGNHESLIEKEGFYYNLYNSQYGDR